MSPPRRPVAAPYFTALLLPGEKYSTGHSDAGCSRISIPLALYEHTRGVDYKHYCTPDSAELIRTGNSERYNVHTYSTVVPPVVQKFENSHKRVLNLYLSTHFTYNNKPDTT